MPRESQKRATAKYQAANIKKYTLGVNRKTEADLIEVLDSIPNRQGYIKSLIRQDMKKRSQ